MKKVNNQYHPHPNHPGDPSNQIEIITWYTPGEGYKATVLPVRISQREGYSLQESGCYTGFNIRIMPCSRRSKKTDQEAAALIAENLTRFLDYFKTPATA